MYSTAVFNLNTLDLYSFSSLSLLTFCRTKSYKKARHKFRKSFKALARELLCNITHPPFTCRSCLNVPISGTKELASRTTNIVWRTRSDTFVLFPLLELTLAVAQHHAGFIFEITLVREIYCPPVLGGHCDTVAMLATTGALAPQRSAVRLITKLQGVEP